MSDLADVTGEKPTLPALKMKWAVLLISLRTGFSPTNGKAGEMQSLWSGTPHSLDVTPHDTPEEYADDVRVQTIKQHL